MQFKTLALLATTIILGAGACSDAADDDPNSGNVIDAANIDDGTDAGVASDDAGDSGAIVREECTPEIAQVLDRAVEGEDVTLSGCALVTERVTVFGGGSVTVEPGSTVLFESAAGFWIQRDSTFRAEGTAREPILLTGVEEQPGFWRGIDYESAASADNVLDHVTIEYAGNDDVAALKVRSGATITVRNTTIRDSASAGFMFGYVSTNSVLAFENNTITSNAETAVVGTMNAASIAPSNELTGNDVDIVRVLGSSAGTFNESVTYQDIGVPYLLIEGLTVLDGATWTIEPGVEIQLAANKRIRIASNGSIVASGTAESPITLRGKESAPGYWEHLEFAVSPSPSNMLEHVVIADAGAGGDSSSAALTLTSGDEKTMRLTLDQVTIRDSAGHGIFGNLALGAFAVTGCDTVTFEGIANDDFAGDPICD